MLKRLLFFLTLTLTLFAHAGEKGQDHPLLPRLPGYEIREYLQKEFDVYDVNLSNDGQRSSTKFHAEGKVTAITYVTLDGHPSKQFSGAGVIANYQNAIKSTRCDRS